MRAAGAAGATRARLHQAERQGGEAGDDEALAQRHGARRAEEAQRRGREELQARPSAQLVSRDFSRSIAELLSVLLAGINLGFLLFSSA